MGRPRGHKHPKTGQTFTAEEWYDLGAEVARLMDLKGRGYKREHAADEIKYKHDLCYSEAAIIHAYEEWRAVNPHWRAGEKTLDKLMNCPNADLGAGPKIKSGAPKKKNKELLPHSIDDRKNS